MCEDFCQELSRAKDTSFNRTYLGDPPSRVICQSQNLTVLVDLSPLCIGHLLLVSNYHYLSFAEVCANHLEEVRDTVTQVLRLCSVTFGHSVILEHGSSPGAEGTSCISHAHWHIIPIDSRAIIAAIAMDGLSYVNLSRLDDLAAIVEWKTPYFYVDDGNIRRVYRGNRTLPQQYMRSIVGAVLGIPDPQWDWALAIRKEYLRKTIKAVKSWRLHGDGASLLGN